MASAEHAVKTFSAKISPQAFPSRAQVRPHRSWTALRSDQMNVALHVLLLVSSAGRLTAGQALCAASC